ncbi:MAG: hypothetical protein KatS3mg121_1425 [Gammaproteobacteria bacterium]|nr:MAG: hypothetical protein KatS3mg121_1425 [Gammaproteobacteria bacterium]
MAEAQRVLSEEELEALAEGVERGAVAVDGGKNTGRRVELYDFHQPAHLLKARLPALEQIDERFAEDLQRALFSWVGRLVKVEAEALSMKKFADAVGALPAHATLARARMLEPGASLLVAVDTPLLNALVDCYFGGRGAVADLPDDYVLTDMERRFAERLVKTALETWSACWAAVRPVKFEFERLETRVQANDSTEASEIMVVCRFGLTLGDYGGFLVFMLPHANLEPLRPVLTAGGRREQGPGADGWRRALRARLESVPVPLQAVLVEQRMPLSRVLAFKKGDWLPVSVKPQALVYSGSRPLFRATAAAAGKRAALQFERWEHD